MDLPRVMDALMSPTPPQPIRSDQLRDELPEYM